MQPTDALLVVERLLGEAGVVTVRKAADLHGSGGTPSSVLQAFCAMATIPADESFEHYGASTRVSDHPDADLLLHESGLGGNEMDRYVVYLTRQFSYEDADGEYAGMNALTIELEAAGVPEGRVPQARRWGYAGRRRHDVPNDSHPEMGNWAGYVDNWARAVEASNSWKVFEHLPPTRIRVTQSNI